jgi:nucleotide-binding universal stress UspA family protein
MKILVPVDASPFSDAALDYVKKMPWPGGTRVIVGSAVAPVPMAYSEAFVPAPSQMESILEDLTTFHRDIATRGTQTLKAAGMDAQAVVLQGDPREAILDLAKRERVDLVVMGSHGRTGLGKLLMGSVASHVVAHAPCSVLVVRAEASGAAKRS